MVRILSLLLFLIVAASPTANLAASDGITDDEYSVYSSLINSRFLPRWTNLAVIEAHTQFDDDVLIPREFEDDLRPKLANTCTLGRRLHIRVKYLLLTENQLDHLFKRDLSNGWDSYWKTHGRHATGLLSFSRVGYNATKDKAFVYASESCGTLCGDGYSFVLTKQKGTWRVAQEKHLWIS